VNHSIGIFVLVGVGVSLGGGGGGTGSTLGSLESGEGFFLSKNVGFLFFSTLGFFGLTLEVGFLESVLLGGGFVDWRRERETEEKEGASVGDRKRLVGDATRGGRVERGGRGVCEKVVECEAGRKGG